MPRAWRRITGQQESTCRAAQRTPGIKLASLGAQLKGLYSRAFNTGNKQEKLETCACLQGCELIGFMETSWDGSKD